MEAFKRTGRMLINNKKENVATNTEDASEDGDFLALRESRENKKGDRQKETEAMMSWVEDELKVKEATIKGMSPVTRDSILLESTLKTEELTPELAQIIEQPVEELAERAVSATKRPSSSKERRFSTRYWAKDSLWAEVEDAAASGSAAFRECLGRLNSSPGLTDKKCRNPKNQQTALHFALSLQNDELIQAAVGIASEDLICAEYDLDVGKISGTKTALHQCVEAGRLDLMKQLMFKITSVKLWQEMLRQETPVEITGQRPRTFPCLHLAAYHGKLDIVKFLVEEAAVNVNSLNANKDTALLLAARCGHVDVVKQLLTYGAKPELENDNGSTALYWAVRYEHTQMVELLARDGKADVNQTRKLGLVAPIVLACALGLEDIVTILLQFGADVNKSIRGGERPIHYAAREGFADIIKLLVSHHAIIDAADERGDTALLLAAKYGRAKALHTLLEFGANVNHKNLLGEDVWSYAVTSDNDLVLKILLVNQSEEDIVAQEGISGLSSVLHLAAAAGHTERIRLLIQMKVDPSITDDDGNNFLHIAAMKNQARVVSELYHLVGVDRVNKFGDSPLHLACDMGHHDVIQVLINLKAMANIQNKNGQTALHVAALFQMIHPHTVSNLIEYIIKTHSWECLNIQDNEGNNPLHIAAKFARPEVLWEYRFVRFKDPDADGNIALHEAVRPGEPEVLEMMLDIFDAMKRDCDINHQNKLGQTALHLAAEAGFLDSVKRLMLFGADISIADHQGYSVLHLLTSLTVTAPSRSSKYLEIIQAILEWAPQWYCSTYDLDWNDSGDDARMLKRKAILHIVSGVETEGGVTVFDLACKVGACDVIQLLVTMDEVMNFKVGRKIRYDITSMIPRTNGNLKGVIRGFTTVAPRPSCLEWLLSNGDRAARVLNLQPFREIESAYGSLTAWTYGLVLVLHIIYIWSGLTLLAKSRNRPGERGGDAATMTTYIFVQIEPLLILPFYMYSLIKLCCMGELAITSKLAGGKMSAAIDAYLTVFRGTLFAASVLAWTIAYVSDYRYMEYFLAVSLCIGWLLSIAYIRGFKSMNYFWRLLKIMVMKDVTKFLFVFLFVLLGFAFAMHAIFQSSPDVVTIYPNPTDTLFLLFNMMIGMDYIFGTGEVEEGFSAVDRPFVYLKILYVLYMILATIVLLNLLIAMMNASYHKTLKKQQMVWRIESVQLGVDIEKTFPWTFPFFSKVKVTKGFICPADRRQNVERWYIEVLPSEGSVLEEVDNSNEASVQKLDKLTVKMSALEVRLSEQSQTLQARVDEVQASLRRLEQTLIPRPPKTNFRTSQ